MRLLGLNFRWFLLLKEQVKVSERATLLHIISNNSIVVRDVCCCEHWNLLRGISFLFAREQNLILVHQYKIHTFVLRHDEELSSVLLLTRCFKEGDVQELIEQYTYKQCYSLPISYVTTIILYYHFYFYYIFISNYKVFQNFLSLQL